MTAGHRAFPKLSDLPITASETSYKFRVATKKGTSMRSVLASLPSARAKSRACRGLSGHYGPRINQRSRTIRRRGGLAFDARVSDTQPMDEVFVEAVRSTDPTVTTRYNCVGRQQVGPLSSSAWRRYVYRWTFSPLMVAGEYEFGAGLHDNLLPGESFTTQYTGYLDNVTLTQVPEPAAVGVGAAALLAAATFRRRLPFRVAGNPGGFCKQL